ncbi:hypothetical protein V8J82_21810 [Gymnodinialimonas sp. 2305UL16-5]|uniref:hypothetical protein n=1 Tax=Gymnodinialimonas mytili TaxID=3126503 RepID=UPI0030ABFF81
MKAKPPLQPRLGDYLGKAAFLLGGTLVAFGMIVSPTQAKRTPTGYGSEEVKGIGAIPTQAFVVRIHKQAMRT